MRTEEQRRGESASVDWGKWLRRLGLVVVSLWMFGMGAAFFIRFSFLVYVDKREAIHTLLHILR